MKKVVLGLIALAVALSAEKTTKLLVSDYINNISEEQKSQICYIALGKSLKRCFSQDENKYTKYIIDNDPKKIKVSVLKDRALLCEMNALEINKDNKASEVKLHGIVDLRLDIAIIYGDQDDKLKKRENKAFFTYISQHNNECLLNENIFYE
ncbi:MAG: hypothetical protein COB67_00520 [SAR324 cluster bacterium]|uniref:Uncharacterized protein n=1 Tax=SAR324 cluster bacterium TaxID=2024889 RepID=A0A2A4TBR0_9DELT|nr:MAG: hypothetical protein COB67_00520 [SAR324 cluster bacterium]